MGTHPRGDRRTASTQYKRPIAQIYKLPVPIGKNTLESKAVE